MTPSILYTACIASAIGLYLLARSSNGPARGIGTLIGLGGLAYLLVGVMGSSEGGMYASILPMIFGIIGVMAAVRVTTHRRPVFAALYFVYADRAGETMVAWLSGRTTWLGVTFEGPWTVILPAAGVAITK